MPADLTPFEDLVYAFARGFAKGSIDGLAENGPQLVADCVLAFRTAFAATIVNAKIDQGVAKSLRDQVADAIKAGRLGGPGAG